MCEYRPATWVVAGCSTEIVTITTWDPGCPVWDLKPRQIQHWGSCKQREKFKTKAGTFPVQTSIMIWQSGQCPMCLNQNTHEHKLGFQYLFLHHSRHDIGHNAKPFTRIHTCESGATLNSCAGRCMSLSSWILPPQSIEVLVYPAHALGCAGQTCLFESWKYTAQHFQHLWSRRPCVCVIVEAGSNEGL